MEHNRANEHGDILPDRIVVVVGPRFVADSGVAGVGGWQGVVCDD
jgi:hypothetical protein